MCVCVHAKEPGDASKSVLKLALCKDTGMSGPSLLAGCECMWWPGLISLRTQGHIQWMFLYTVHAGLSNEEAITL